MSESENAVDRVIRKTPWWGISTFFHVVLLMIAALLFGVHAMAEEDEPVVVRPPRKPRPIPILEKPRDFDLNKKVLDHPRKSEIPVFRKVEEADLNESEDDEEFRKMKGDSPDFVSDKPFRNRSTFDAIGLARPSGGKFGVLSGGRKNLVTIGGGSEETESAVLAALRWLARHQNRDGSWKADEYAQECNKVARYSGGGRCFDEQGRSSCNSGVTGLAILAFLGAGYSHYSKDSYDGICFGNVVKKGIKWILSRQRKDGQIGASIRGQKTYNHLICSLALNEAYGRTGGSLLESPARRALDFTLAMQNLGTDTYRFGWRYGVRPRDNDASVSGFAVMVLKSAELSGLRFSRDIAYEGASAFFDSVTSPVYYRVGYYRPPNGRCHHPNMTGVATMYRLFVEREQHDAKIGGGVQILLSDLPRWKPGQIDFYYWYYGSLALFQYGGEAWETWNRAMVEALLPNQWRDRGICNNGSWDPVGCWTRKGGRVYATAINALTLEVYYRYANVFTGLVNR